MPAKSNLKNEKFWLYLIAGVVIFVVVLVRLRLLGVALDRDEGEYGYIGQQLLQGILPYTESYTMKLPGIYMVFAAILGIFGETHTAIHFALLLANLATAFLLFLLGRNLFNESTGIAAGVSFLVLTLSPSVQGFSAYAENFVIFFAVGGLLLMRTAQEKESQIRLFLSGILLGFAFLTKQQGVFFPMFGFFCCLFYFKDRAKNINDFSLKAGTFALGGATPFLLTVIIYWATGNFDDFWFWTFEYASLYTSMVTLSKGVGNLIYKFNLILDFNLPVVLLALVGIASVAWNKSARSNYGFALGFLLFSFLATTPGFYFRQHYFILFIPAIALFSGMGAASILNRRSSYWLNLVIPLLIISSTWGYAFYKQKPILFDWTHLQLIRATYGPNPFPESFKIAEYISEHTDKEDTIAILGSEPQILFYAKRKSAVGNLYMYPLTEVHPYARLMQEQMIQKIELRQPKVIIFVNMSMSWLMRPNSVSLLADWFPGYLKENYKISGIVDIRSYDKTLYQWGDEAVKTLSDPKKYSDLIRGSMGTVMIYKKNELSN